MPSRVIGGENTNLYAPYALVIDTNNYLYVANIGIGPPSLNFQSISVYAPLSSGNVFPIRTIAGPQTHLGWSAAGNALAPSLALDPVGNLLVTVGDYDQNWGYNSAVLIINAEANGNQGPVRVINGALIEGPTGIVFGPG